MSARTDLIAAALALAAEGYPVFPCRSPKKSPAISKADGGKGFHDASTDPERITRMFRHRNAALIGVPTGPISEFDVLDLDYRHGAADWEQANAHRLPASRTHQTMSGGKHLLFKHAPGVRNSASSIAPGVDIRGEGGYVIVPPSTGYSVVSQANVAEWPDWLLTIVLPAVEPAPIARPSEPRRPVPAALIERIVDRALDKVRSAGEGQKHFTLRNQALLIGGVQHLGGYSDADALRWLMDALPGSVASRSAAEETAIWGLKNGKSNPIEIEDRPPTSKAKPERRAANPTSSDPTGTSPSTADELILSGGSPLISARHFVDRHHTRDDMRTLLHQNGTFFTWQRSHYAEMTGEEMRAGLYRFLDQAKRVTDEGEVLPFDPTRAKVANIVEATAAETQLSHLIRPPAWLGGGSYPAATDIIACANKLLHLPTGETHPHTPRFYTLNALPFDYQPAAPKPIAWLDFLGSVWPGDQEAIDTLQELFGLALTAETKYQKLFLIVGPKRSGKGTIARVLTQMLGAENVCGPTLSGLSTNFGLAPLIGKRVAIISDARLSGKADQAIIVERLLSITGEDGITVDRKFRDGWTGKMDVRFVILTNELPRLTDSSGALAGRFIILRMTETFYGKEDLGLGAKLTPELPGILLWAIEGWKRLEARGYFVPPASSREAQQELEDLGSPIGAFLREVCIVGKGQSIGVDIIYRDWCKWCEDQGRDHPGTKQTFGKDLGSAIPGLKVVQPRTDEGGRTRVYEGVGWRPRDPLARTGTRTTPLRGAFYDDIPPPTSYPYS